MQYFRRLLFGRNSIKSSPNFHFKKKGSVKKHLHIPWPGITTAQAENTYKCKNRARAQLKYAYMASISSEWEQTFAVEIHGTTTEVIWPRGVISKNSTHENNAPILLVLSFTYLSLHDHHQKHHHPRTIIILLTISSLLSIFLIT